MPRAPQTVRHEQVCGTMLKKLTPGFPDYQSKTSVGRATIRNIEWPRHNGARYWNG